MLSLRVYARDRASSTSLQSVNTVDSLFAAFPAFLYFNPELAGYLLAPLFQYQDPEAYTLGYAAKNIGMIPIELVLITTMSYVSS